MKKIIRNLKMAKKMMLLPTVVFVFLLVLAYGAYDGLSIQRMVIGDMYNNRFKVYQDTTDIIKKVSNIHANIYKIISWAGANYEESKITALANEQKASMEKTIELVQNTLKSSALTSEEKKLFQKTLDDVMEYQKPMEGVITVGASDLNAAAMFMGTTDDKYQVLNQTLIELLALENKLSKEQYDSSLSKFNAWMRTFVIVLVIAIVISVLINIFITKLITQPIKETIEVIKKVAEGDLTQEIDINSKDEIGDLASSINTMRVKMGEAVGQSLSISQVLSESSSRQAAALEETSSSLDEMASMTRQNASNTAEANKLMAAAKQAIEKANASMTDLTKSMKEIATASEQTQKIIKSIDEVAFQTNLLALNAAVEAARAGEAGAGFAVVADEVRNLAMRATDSAKNTATLIEDIVKKVKGGESLVNVTNEVFSEVTTSSTKVVELMGEIAAASQEQSQGIDQVNRAMAEMSQVTQQNAASAEELSATMAMFKVDDQKGQLLVEDLSQKRSLKKQSPSQYHQVSSEKILPLKEDDFV
ncbi:MAG TPA: methyl-accepting chemotaxis protein [Syntrophales bacterium]|nr:methyl-accepting chemotaxis protein [Syntrophales bacterium]